MIKKSAKLFGLLKNEKLEIDAILQYVSSNKFNRKKDKNSWSMAQIIEHIYLAETQTLEAIKWRIANKKEFPSASFKAYLKVFYTVSLFALDVKMKAPAFVAPSSEYINKNDLLDKWQASRAEWSEFIYRFPKRLRGKVVYKHPILGYLSLELALTFMFHHLHRHRAQLIELVEMNEIFEVYEHKISS